MAYPALNVVGLSTRTVIPADYVQWAEQSAPGFVSRSIARWTERVYAQLRKRYGNGAGDGALWQTTPTLVAAGTAPPAVTLSGLPAWGSVEIKIQVTTPGALATAVVQWSDDGGTRWYAGVTTAAVVALGSTGLAANFSAGTYGADNVYTAATPVSETVLGWVAALVGLDVARKRGVSPQDPAAELLVADAKRALDEIGQAANAETGLFDLPPSPGTSGAGGDCGRPGSGVGPLFYSESSPYVSADRLEREGRRQDAQSLNDFDDWGARTW